MIDEDSLLNDLADMQFNLIMQQIETCIVGQPEIFDARIDQVKIIRNLIMQKVRNNGRRPI